MALKYRTIVADPPWSYGRDDARFPSYPGKSEPGFQTRVEKEIPYPTMTDDEIRALPVRQWASVNCRLFLWATNKHLPVAISILASWGFVYRQTLVWHKTGDAPRLGGSVAPNHAEFLLVGQRGAPEVTSRWTSSVVPAPRGRGHSAKPDAFLDIVEAVSPGPYLEMFARRARFGWHYWGDESLNTAEVAA